MKSKTSFFNRTIFAKNIKRFWPVWSIYTVLTLFHLPVMLLMLCQSKAELFSETDNELSIQFQILNEVTSVHFTLLVITYLSVILACLLFGYLNKSQSAYMMHSLPVTRTELFCTNYVSGLSFMIVPQIFTFLISVVIGIACGITKVQYFGIWLLIAMGVSVIAYNMSVFCVFLTGQTYVIPLAYLVLNYGYYIFYYMPHSLILNIGYGINDAADTMNWTMPLAFLQDKLSYSYTYDELGRQIADMKMEGIGYVPLYMLASFVLLAVAFVMYQKRQMEVVGEFIAIKFLRPVFRWVAGLIGGYFISNIIFMIFSIFIMYIPDILIFGLVLLMSIVSYIFAEMLIKKSFRVFSWKKIKEMACFIVFIIASIAVLVLGVVRMERYIPRQDEVERVYVNQFEPIEYTGEDIEKVIHLHERVVANKDKFKNNEYAYTYLNIRYEMRNGDNVTRSYRIPDNVGKEIITTVENWELEPQNIINLYFGYGLKEITGVNDMVFYREADDKNYDLSYLTQEQRLMIAEALLADAKSGNLSQYNIRYKEETESETRLGIIDFSFMAIYTDSNFNMYDRYYQTNSEYFDLMSGEGNCGNTTSVSFGSECTNTLKVLKELNIDVQN